MEIGAVVDTEALEWREQSAVECLPQSQLDRDPAAKPVEDRLPVGTLGRRRETEEHLRAEVLEKARIRLRLSACVVELVHDDHVEGLRIEISLEVDPGQRLHR